MGSTNLKFILLSWYTSAGLRRRSITVLLLSLLNFAAAQAEEPVEVYIWGQQPTSAATEQTRWSKDLELRPANTPSDVLRLTPDLVISQHHGGGKADQILFRGFDSDHGTDFQVSVDGIPVNMVSHAHGQGYADLHWLIPETVEKVEIYKGSYFPHLGDFATSGAMNIITKRRAQDTTLTVMGGSYDTQRYLGILSPPEGTFLTPYIAFEAYHNNGPFKNPDNYNRLNLLSNFTLFSTASSNLSFLGTYFKTRWNASGEIPSRAVRDDSLGRFGSEDPSEGGNSERQNLSLIYNHVDAQQSLTLQSWASWYRLQLWSNFTFFLNDPVNGDAVPLAPCALAFTGFTARHDSGLQARLQMRYIGSRYGIEDRSVKVPQSAVFDLLLKYIWKRYEFFVSFENIANRQWRAAEHVFTSRLQGEPPAGVLDAHFTSGEPFTAKAGMTVHLW
jgi:outer membrane receptor protein involved in Fe transport